MAGVNLADQLAALGSETNALATLVEQSGVGGLRATVPTCPDWKVSDLLRHVGGLQRWSSHLVANGVVEETWRSALPIVYPHDNDGPEAWADWLWQGAGAAISVFAEADPNRPVWGWAGDQHARFWPRRMLFETAVHRVDARLAVGDERALTDFDAGLGAEGMDEHLEHLPWFSRWGDRLDGLRSLAGSVAFGRWRIRLQGSSWVWDRGGPAASDCAVAAPDGTLYLIALRRAGLDGAAVTGDRSLAEAWLEATAF